MEKRVVLAVLLMTAVILVSNILFPPPPPPEEPTPAPVEVVTEPFAPELRVPVEEPAVAVAADTVVVSSELYRYAFSTWGAALLKAELPRYPSYTQADQPVQLVPAGVTDLLAHRLVVAGDTLDLRAAPFRLENGSAVLEPGDEPHSVRLNYGPPDGFGMELVYTFHPDNYLVNVRGRVRGLGGAAATLLTELGTGLEPHEHPAHRSEQQLSVVARPPANGVQTLPMERIRGPQRLVGPFAWAGIKDKYFLISLITPPDAARFSAVLADSLPPGEYAIPVGERVDTMSYPRARTVAELPVAADGTFAFDAYLGPQEYGRLAALGQGLQEVNPYGYRWLRPVIRPIAAAILWVLDLMHNTLGIGYGWVLVLFGVLMRIVLWPLNAKAMRAQMKNMAVQPLMQEAREKHKDDPQKMQQEMIRLYKEHGFNPLAGCLPLLVPMPVLITLFFVFQDSIAFRGESFFWLPDLSLRDPVYVLPVFLVVSMFALQWISAKSSGMEQNPQMKMMMYFMPLFIGFIFFMLPSGLNLYYATTNVATIPQQVLIGRERKRAQEALKQQQAAERAASTPPAGPRPSKGKRKAKRRS